MENRDLQESFLRILYKEFKNSQEEPTLALLVDFLRTEHEQQVREELLRVFPVFFKTLDDMDAQKIVDDFLRFYRPTSSDIAEVAQTFFNFFVPHPKVKELPVLVAIAKLEMRREQSRRAPRIRSLDLASIVSVLSSNKDPVFSLQPHVNVSTFEHPAYTIWKWAEYCSEERLHSGDQTCQRLPIEEYNESVMSYRSGTKVATEKIKACEAMILRELRAGKSLREIEAECGHRVEPAFLESLVAKELLVADQA